MNRYTYYVPWVWYYDGQLNFSSTVYITDKKITGELGMVVLRSQITEKFGCEDPMILSLNLLSEESEDTNE